VDARRDVPVPSEPTMTAAAPDLLLVYESVDGHTAAVAERIADRLRAGGAQVRATTTGQAPAPVDVDAVVLGDPIHAGQHTHHLTEYLTTHAAALTAVPTALFQVCLTSADDDPEHVATAAGYLDDLTAATGLQPALTASFAGALPYTRYGRLKRALMKRIAAKGGLATDVSRDHVLTDWAAVDRFADDVLGLATGAEV
ncbi:MAG: flavodoxin domain-containing protein, partial [Nitriliruptoraceae bacterium]